MYNPLSTSSCLWLPERVSGESAWTRHIPFAFALVETLRPNIFVELGTHRGDSYCAFCQAVRALKLPTKCYAVDTWTGDMHSGLYGPDVLAELREYHEPRYGDFSQLLQLNFDAARSQFGDGVIDLLHIDGCHTYEAVKHDFETWQSAMSCRGVVLLHDIEVRDRDFGVWRLWEELSQQYEHFALPHVHGLGVVVVGREIPDAFRSLVSQWRESETLHHLFDALGCRVDLAIEAESNRALVIEQQTSIELQQALLDERQSRADQLENRLVELESLCQEQEVQLVEQERQFASEIEQSAAKLATQSSKLASYRHELASQKDENERLQHQLHDLQLYYSQPRFRFAEKVSRVIRHKVAPEGTRRRRALQLARRSAASGYARGRAATSAARTRWRQGRETAKGTLSQEQAAEVLSRLTRRPLISIVVPVHKIDALWLDKCIRSVATQYYQNWELRLVDDGSCDPRLTSLLKRWAARDARIQFQTLSENVGISRASNLAIEAARGEFIGFLDHDDELAPDALVWIAAAHNRHPDALWFYSDEDVVGLDGQATAAAYKPDFSPEYLLSAMYTCHFSVYSASLLRRAGGLRPGFEGAQDHDLALRLSELVQRHQVVHIPRILYHWRMLPESTATGGQAKPYAAEAGRRAVYEALQRRGAPGEVESHPVWPTLYQVRLQPRTLPKVSVIIPTRNGFADLKKCLESAWRQTRYPNYEVIVIDNQSDDQELLDYLRDQQAAGTLKVVAYPKPFNHSAMHNEVVATCDSEFLVFMNNDVEILSENWLEMLVATAQLDPSIAGVGALLVYPDQTIQHAGVLMGLGGAVGHAHKYLPADQPGYCGRAHALNEFSGATAALLLMRRSAYLKIGGFDAQRYPASYNDVDLWLKLRRSGFRCLYNPLVRAIHFESRSRGVNVADDLKLQLSLHNDWGMALACDPFYNPNLGRDNEQFAGVRHYPVNEGLLAGMLQSPPDAKKPLPLPRWKKPLLKARNFARLGRRFTQHASQAGIRSAVRRTASYAARRYPTAARPARLTRQFVAHSRVFGVRSALGRARHYVLSRRLAPPAAPPMQQVVASPAVAAPQQDLKGTLTRIARIALDAFLHTGATLDFPQFAAPRVSILLVLYNRAELTLACLNSLLACQDVAYEVILVDNASADQTPELLSRIRGASVLSNRENRGFAAAVNQASREARGDYLLLLNNDTQLLGNSLRVAEQLISSQPDIGAVGAKIVLLDGTLQEAGSILWQDGSASGYGRGDRPDAAAYMFQREVDFCSGAFLMTPRKLFLKLGGFDEVFSPAYYEDVDYCVQLHQAGWRVVYHPDVVLLHYESASSTGNTALQLMQQKREVFVNRQQAWLQDKLPYHPDNVLAARTSGRRCERILFIEDRPPHSWMGTGYPRANRMLSDMVQMGYFVTLFPLIFPDEPWSTVYQDHPREVEVMIGRSAPGEPYHWPESAKQQLRQFLESRRGYYDVVLVSRPHNMGILKELIDTDPTLLQGAKILYDAEAIYCLREARERALLGKPLRPSELESRMRDELELSQGCAGIIAVNNAEAQHFRDYCSQPVHTLGHALESCPTPNSFEQRSGLLFVGAIHDPISPNGDSTRWLVREIMPAIDRSTGTPVPLSLAGYWCPGVITDPIDEQRIRVLGRVDDLTCLYNEARIFVAPTRFAGGIPLKVYEAAAHGVPVVATSLIRQQLGWTADEEILVADTPEEFAAQCLRLYQDPQLWRRVREAALRATMRDCSSEAFIRKLEEILDKTMDRGAFTLAIPEPHFTQRRQAEQEGRFSLVSRHG